MPASYLAMLSAIIITATIISQTQDVVAFSTPATSTSSLQSMTTFSSQQHACMNNSRSSPALYMAKGTAQNKGNNKKRRFLQEAHPIPTSTSPERQPSTANNLGNLTGNRNNNNSQQQQQQQQSAVESNNNKGNSNKRRGPPLQTSKSIDELEAILENRWGTAQTTPKGTKTSNEEADFVMDFGNSDDEYDDETHDKSELRGAAVFRSNRVLDPWAKEEGLYDAPSDSSDKNADEDSSSTGKSKKQGGYNRQEAMLNRVRSNQERLQSKRSTTPNNKKNDSFEVPIVPIASKDYYDEDDEGYETTKRDSRSSLISPKPVGGSGGSRGGRESASAASSLSGGIFSDRAPDTRDKRSKDRRGEERVRDDTKKEKRQKRKKEPRLPPLLDEDGNEMYLTLDQADTIVQNILSSTTSSGDDGDEIEEDITADNEISEWEDIGITNPTLLSNLQSSTMTCPYPLPVQDKACPPIVAMNDVLISTHTGSGKTLAFLAPIAQSLMINASANKTPGASGAFPKAIIVAPGRELASQIVSVAQTLFKDTGLSVSMAIGGTPYSRNVEQLRKKKPDVVVGTPGRIAELIIGRPGDKAGKMKISGLQTIVLDEFDALLQYDSHKEPTMAIMAAIDRQHGQSLQRVLCSATATDMIGQNNVGPGPNIEDYLRPGYAHASVDDSDLLVTSTPETKGGGKKTTSARVSRTTIHGALHVPHQRLALESVRKILNTEPIPQQVLIFVNSPRRVDIVIEKLAKMDIIAAPLHGGAGSGKGDRAQVNKALREGYVGLVVATEMAARGIDAPYLTHVINLDLPTDASHYAHRAGRCGRGGRPGVAVSITCDSRTKNVPKRFAEELGITMYNVEAREGKLRIVQ